MPISATRRFDMHVKRTFMNPQWNKRGSNEEVVRSEICQVGTQFDGFAHQTIDQSLDNCFKLDEIATRTGFTKLGIENVGALITRGVLLGVAALKGVDMLADNYEITVADLQQALQRQSLTLQPGDAVIIHTGWGKLWAKDNGRYQKGNPGIDVAANGIHLLENLKLDELAAKRVHEFALRDAAAEAEGSDRLNGCADRDPLNP